MSAVAYPRYEATDFAVGFESSHAFTVEAADLARFAAVSGDQHPLHRDEKLSAERGLPGLPVHGMLIASRCSAFIARDIVGSHGFLVALTADFRQPVYCGEPLVWRGKVSRVIPDAGMVELSWGVTNDRKVVVQRGTACAVLTTK